MTENIDKFLSTLAASVAGGTFVKATLGNYKGSEKHLQKISIRPIVTKRGRRLFFLYKYDTRDTAKNYDFNEANKLVADLFAEGFRSGHLFTTDGDLQLEIGKNGRSRLNTAKPTFRTAPKLEHDRQKATLVDVNSFYLHALGITTDKGEIRAKQHDKWRQINKFVEILSGLVARSELKDAPSLRMVDMGCGKGYLTFAAYDHFAARGVDVRMTGVETRGEIVSFCNDVARSSEFNGLEFVNGTIEDVELSAVDILIALHACNTATDDAIYKGIRANAGLIVVAPCCHQEIRPMIKPPEMFRDILKHGVMLERTAETITDGLRSLLLEREGYATKMLEFISIEHTPKNNMLIGSRSNKPPEDRRIRSQIAEIKQFFGIEHMHLEDLLDGQTLTQTTN